MKTLEHRLMVECSETWCMRDLFNIMKNEGLDKYTAEDVMKSFAYAWGITEFLYPYKDTLRLVLSIMKPHKHHFMDKEEREYLKKLPNQVWIYRGASDKNGLSWTLDREKAEWFAQRNQHFMGEEMKVFEKKVHKNRIFAYLNGRKEQEIILI